MKFGMQLDYEETHAAIKNNLRNFLLYIFLMLLVKILSNSGVLYRMYIKIAEKRSIFHFNRNFFQLCPTKNDALLRKKFPFY